MTLAIRSRTLIRGARPSGNETTVIIPLKRTRCAALDQLDTATTAPKRSRHRPTAELREPSVSSLSRTAKIAASERNQLRDHAATQIRPASGRNSRNTSPGPGCSGEEAKRARIAAPSKATIAASTTATRKKLRPKRERGGRVLAARSCECAPSSTLAIYSAPSLREAKV